MYKVSHILMKNTWLARFLSITIKLTSPFYDVEISSFPKDLKQDIEYNTSKTGGITFSWKELECEHWNGVLHGYEIKLYSDDEVCTKTVVKSVTSFTILPQWNPELCFPRAISVAAINQFGVGIHCPPVNITLSG